MPADLHIHTNFSDGLYSPEDTVNKAVDARLTAIAITDHDTVDGIERAQQEASKTGLKLIPGIEFTTDIPDAEIHILGYYIDNKAKWFLDLLDKIMDDRVNRIGKIIDKLNKLGVEINSEDVMSFVDKGSAGRPHVARAMVKYGKVKTVQEAFDRYLDSSGPAYVPHFKLTPIEAIKVIIKARGIPVFAHPGLSNRDDLIPEMVKAGLKGIEVFYSRHSRKEIEKYLALAKEHDLLVTGGSDFHGSLIREVSLGDITLSDKYFAIMEEYHAAAG